MSEYQIGDVVSWEDYDGNRSGQILEVHENHVKVKLDFRMFHQNVKKHRIRKLEEKELLDYYKRLNKKLPKDKNAQPAIN